ncbi:hypothetical protein [Pueribacillus sp. YX66]
MGDCPKCLGNGEIELMEKDVTEDFESKLVPCPLCNGIGTLE